MCGVGVHGAWGHGDMGIGVLGVWGLGKSQGKVCARLLLPAFPLSPLPLLPPLPIRHRFLACHLTRRGRSLVAFCGWLQEMLDFCSNC